MMEQTDKAFKQASAFQNMWLETFSTMSRVFADFSPGKPPPEQIRSMRSGMLKVLSESWDQFMRTDEFKGMMQNSVQNMTEFKKASNDMMTKFQHQSQAPARQDIDSVLLAIRHSERMVLERVDDLAKRVATLEGKKTAAAAKPKKRTVKKKAVVKKATKKVAKKTAKKAARKRAK